MFSMSRLSTEFVRVGVQARESGSSVDPTVDPVFMAFVEDGEPSGWIAAGWEVDGGFYYARLLVGPAGGSTQLTPGLWEVWVKITDNPEAPVRHAGRFRVV